MIRPFFKQAYKKQIWYPDGYASEKLKTSACSGSYEKKARFQLIIDPTADYSNVWEQKTMQNYGSIAGRKNLICGQKLKVISHFVRSWAIRPIICTVHQDHLRNVHAKYNWPLCNYKDIAAHIKIWSQKLAAVSNIS